MGWAFKSLLQPNNYLIIDPFLLLWLAFLNGVGWMIYLLNIASG